MKSGIDRIGRDVSVAQARRGCFEKVRYGTKNAARDVAAKMQNSHPEWRPARPYKCALCSGFHLTTTVSKGKDLKRSGRERPAA